MAPHGLRRSSCRGDGGSRRPVALRATRGVAPDQGGRPGTERGRDQTQEAPAWNKPDLFDSKGASSMPDLLRGVRVTPPAPRRPARIATPCLAALTVLWLGAAPPTRAASIAIN